MAAFQVSKGIPRPATASRHVFLFLSTVTCACVTLYTLGVSNALARADAASGCITPGMDVAARAAAKNLTVDEYTVLREQVPIDSVEYCRLSTMTLRKAVTAAAKKHAEAEAKAAAGVWSRIEYAYEQYAGESEDEDAEGAAPDPEYFRLRYIDENGTIPADGNTRAQAQIAAMKQAQAGRAAGINRASWVDLGPGNIGGRVRALAIDPTNTSVMYLGGVAGGVWKSTDAGASWQHLDDFMANMAVTTLAIDPNDPQTVYAGTGEDFASSKDLGGFTRGSGIFVSHNAGSTWEQLSSTIASTENPFFKYCSRLLAVNVSGSTVLFVATDAGIAKSVDAGATWVWGKNPDGSNFAPPYPILFDLEVSPTNNNILLSSGFNKIWQSTDAGATWRQRANIPTSGNDDGNTGAIELSWSVSSPQIVYASVDKSSGMIYKSTNGGTSFSLVSTPKHLENGQGYYDNVIWVDPTNANTLLYGGIDLFRSTDGGKRSTRISDWSRSPISAHADQHIIVADPGFNGTTNKKVYFGNDGGVYRTDNYKTVARLSGWTELNNTLGITQFYSVRGSASQNFIIGGTQDNGYNKVDIGASAESWNKFYHYGDGFTALVDQTDQRRIYLEYTNLMFLCRRMLSGSCEIIDGWNNAYTGLKATKYVLRDAIDGTALFNAPYMLDPNNANSMLAGGASLWRSTNIKAAVTNTVGPIWSVIKKPSGRTQDYYISAIAVATGNSNIIWVGNAKGGVWKSANGTAAAASVTWTSYDAALPNRFVSDIEVVSTDSNTVYVTFGGYAADNLYKTTDGGATWSAATGSGASALPSIPIWSIAIHPSHPTWLYAGTELGVFTSEDGGATWQVSTDGPANVPIYDLSWMGDTLLAATHGRGIWSTTTNN